MDCHNTENRSLLQKIVILFTVLLSLEQLMASVLIVDDEEDIANPMRQYLIDGGFDAVSFTSPLLAFEHFRHNPYAYPIIITDLRMPGMNGIELANRIREINGTVKIFMVTAFDTTDLESKPDYIRAKIEMIIQKPIKLSQLRKIVEQFLQTP